MIEVRDLFEQRSDEVTRYLDFLVAIDDAKANVIAHAAGGIVLSFAEDSLSRELIKTLRANGYLLIYNLVESTMTNAIDGIHRCYKIKECEFSALSDSLKKIVLESFKRAIGNGSPKILADDHPIQRAITFLGYDKESIFSGNLDAREIKNTARRYGFKISEKNKNKSRDGFALKGVKDTRNDLAHGKKSFEECGHATSADTLKMTGQEAIAYLDDALTGIEEYVRDGQYMASA